MWLQPLVKGFSRQPENVSPVFGTRVERKVGNSLVSYEIRTLLWQKVPLECFVAHILKIRHPSPPFSSKLKE